VITIVDYGMGNLRSVERAFRWLGFDASIEDDPEKVRAADSLVLPGVGAFGQARETLDALGLTPAIREYAAAGKALLGICLGMQLLASLGEEGGTFPGLDLVPGTVRRFPAGPKVPHVGWNEVSIRQVLPLFRGIPQGSYFYFVHSYELEPGDPATVAATTDYSGEFCSAVQAGNIFGVQFHPEKSGGAGLQLLRNFAEMGML